MTVRKLHKLVGLVLLIPFFGWAITGFVFFLKPGYTAAYEILTPRTYPLSIGPETPVDRGWKEIRYLKTILGDHLLVKTNQGWLQLDPKTLQPRGVPNETELRTLLNDAFSANPSRYGQVANIIGTTAVTNTG